MSKNYTKTEISKIIKELVQSNSNNEKRSIGNGMILLKTANNISYHSKIKKNGKSTTKLLGNVNKISYEEALKLAERYRFEQSLLNGDGITLGQYFELWAENKKRGKTIKNYKNSVQLFKHLDPLFCRKLSEIKQREIEACLDNADTTDGQKHALLKQLNALYKDALRENLIQKNQMMDISKYGRIAEKFKKPLSKGYAFLPIDTLIDVFFSKVTFLDKIDLVFHLVALFTGLRLNAVLHLKWSNINFEDNKIDIPIEYRKGNEETILRANNGDPDFKVPITPYFKSVLLAWKKFNINNGIKSEFLFYSKTDCNTSKRRADEEELVAKLTNHSHTIHGYRKTLRTWAAEYGFDSEAAEKTLDHSDPQKIVSIYAKSDLFDRKFNLMCYYHCYIYHRLPDFYKEKFFIDLNKDFDVICNNKLNNILENHSRLSQLSFLTEVDK